MLHRKIIGIPAGSRVTYVAITCRYQVAALPPLRWEEGGKGQRGRFGGCQRSVETVSETLGSIKVPVFYLCRVAPKDSPTLHCLFHPLAGLFRRCVLLSVEPVSREPWAILSRFSHSAPQSLWSKKAEIGLVSFIGRGDRKKMV